MWRFILLFAIVDSGLCGIFDGHFDDPYNIFMTTRNALLRQYLGSCTAKNSQGTIREGICLTRPECSIHSGESLRQESTCLIGVCCIFKYGCGATPTPNKRILYFENSAPIQSPCELTVTTENPNICQMRLDFETFDLAQPTQTAATDPFECKEYFTVLNHKEVPQICGNNDGQHMYIPIIRNGNQNSITMRVVTDNNSKRNRASWRIKIRQLECPGSVKHEKPLRLADDFNLLAPDGCLQYYKNTTLRIRNFGYDESLAVANNHYTTDLNYAICFARETDTTGIRFTTNIFQLSGMDGTCLNQDENDGDFLFVPDGKLAPANTIRNRFCGVIPQGSDIHAETPGPLYAFFHTDDRLNEGNENGFVLDYTIEL